MSGETDLAVILSTLEARCDGVEYGYATLPRDAMLPAGIEPVCTFLEDEGLTVVAPATVLDGAGIDQQTGWARLTLTIHTSLDAIGVTAVIAAALAQAGISANVVAAYYHDHVFVPWDRRGEAIAALENLRRSAEGTPAPTG